MSANTARSCASLDYFARYISTGINSKTGFVSYKNSIAGLPVRADTGQRTVVRPCRVRAAGKKFAIYEVVRSGAYVITVKD